jgi:hypothetical protein
MMNFSGHKMGIVSTVQITHEQESPGSGKYGIIYLYLVVFCSDLILYFLVDNLLEVK